MESAYITRTTQLIEYMNLHLISLEQDSEAIAKELEDDYEKIEQEIKFFENYLKLVT